MLILVLFMLMNREVLGDRIVQLFGQSQINLTTRTMAEIGQRISRYLVMITLVSSGFGLVVGLGLWTIGVPYAVLWGCLAAMTRFVPYVGTAVAFGLPAVFSVAHFPGWRQPLEVVAMFGVIEVALGYLEPLIYGKTTGVSALAQARYQVRRLRARFAALPILVGRWGEGGSNAASEGLSGVGATHVAFTLADARDQILARVASAVPATAMTADARDLHLSEHPCRADLRADRAVKAVGPVGL